MGTTCGFERLKLKGQQTIEGGLVTACRFCQTLGDRLLERLKQLHETTGKPSPTIYDDLKAAFSIAHYQDIPEAEWDMVTNWFKVQIQRVKRR